MKRSYGTLTGNTTITVSMSNDQDVALVLTQGGTGSYTVTWSGVTTWLTPAGSAPTLKTAVGASDMLLFSKVNGSVFGQHISEAGAAGSTGATGPAGVQWRGAWASGSSYSPGPPADLASDSGSTYIALQASSSSNAQQPSLSPSYWAAFATGATGTSSGGGAEYVDTYVRADLTNISTNAPFSYTILGGTSLEILTNRLHDANASGTAQHARAEQVMTSVDHHAQITLATYTWASGQAMQAGVACRYDSSANTAYIAFYQPFNSSTQIRVSISKIVAGSITVLASSSALSPTPVAGDTLKLTVVGTTLTAYHNGVQQVTTTDSSITTGVRAGLYFTRGASTDIAINELRMGA